jgi:hypothetical protein
VEESVHALGVGGHGATAPAVAADEEPEDIGKVGTVAGGDDGDLLERPDAEQAAAGILSLIVGCLVFGALMPGRAVGFAAPSTRATLEAVLLATATSVRPS